MAIETKIEETKQVVLKRVPPGDSWIFAGATPGNIQGDIHPTLTDALEAWYQAWGDTQFFLDARRGTVEIIKTHEVKVEKPVTRYSLYGED